MPLKLDDNGEIFLQELSAVAADSNYRYLAKMPGWRVWEAIMILSNLVPDKECFNYLNSVLASKAEPLSGALLRFYESKQVLKVSLEMKEIEPIQPVRGIVEPVLSSSLQYLTDIANRLQPRQDWTELFVKVEDCMEIAKKSNLFVLSDKLVEKSTHKDLLPIEQLRKDISLHEITLEGDRRVEEIAKRVLSFLNVEVGLDKSKLPPLQRNFFLLLREIDPCFHDANETLRAKFRKENICKFRRRASEQEKKVWDELLVKYRTKNI